MKNIALRRSGLVALAAISAAIASPAFAAFTAPPAQAFEKLMGDSATKTGVWELQEVITVAGLAIVLLTITMVGIVFARKVVRKFG